MGLREDFPNVTYEELFTIIIDNVTLEEKFRRGDFEEITYWAEIVQQHFEGNILREFQNLIWKVDIAKQSGLELGKEIRMAKVIDDYLGNVFVPLEPKPIPQPITAHDYLNALLGISKDTTLSATIREGAKEAIQSFGSNNITFETLKSIYGKLSQGLIVTREEIEQLPSPDQPCIKIGEIRNSSGVLVSSSEISCSDLDLLLERGYTFIETTTPTPTNLIEVKREVWLGKRDENGNKIFEIVTVKTIDTIKRPIIKIEELKLLT